MRFRSLCITALMTILMPTAKVSACTSLMAAKDGTVLAGHNEDWNGSNHRINFIPATSGHFGSFSISWGFDWTQGGMNDQGLFLGDNSVAETGWSADPAKSNFPGNPRLEILQTCATASDVKHFFETYNVTLLKILRFPVADRSGASMVVEYAKGKVPICYGKCMVPVSTNFLRTIYPGDTVPCWRFPLAMQMLGTAGQLNAELFRSVLSATHQEGATKTIYSCIYDLKEGLITLYYRYNYQKAIVFNLVEELKKGHQSIQLPSLFAMK